jgi:flagellar motor switch protein FliN/FliY
MIPAEQLLHAPKPSESPAATDDDPRLPAAHVIAMSELDPRAGELRHPNGASRSPALVAAVGDAQSPLRHIKARLMVCVGTAEVTVGELLDAKEEQVLRLDRTVEQPVDLLLEGHVVARGTLVAVDDHFGVRITELPVALDVSLAGARKP